MNTPPHGDIRIGPRAIASVVKRAIAAVDGCAGLVPSPKALVVRETGSGLMVEIETLIIYGAPIEATARLLSMRVRAALEQAIGQPIADVRVYVQGLRHP
ncbi:MAG: Asp23/Gls24 family envelope stress response protein [Roseiflexaceae bacterium]|nr:Asp23/Gls24 family envelope stress response protein [Roseiflexaceae bacterium]